MSIRTARLSAFDGAFSSRVTRLSSSVRHAIKSGRLIDGKPDFLYADTVSTVKELVRFESSSLIGGFQTVSDLASGKPYQLKNNATLTDAPASGQLPRDGYMGGKVLNLPSSSSHAVAAAAHQYNSGELANTGWTEEFTLQLTSTVTGRRIWRAVNAKGYGIVLNTDGSGKLRIYLSSNGTSWDIANGTVISTLWDMNLSAGGTSAVNTLAAGRYTLALTYDNEFYRLFVNGSLIYVLASPKKICKVTSKFFGHTSYSPVNAKYDSYRLSAQARYTAPYVPTGDAFPVPDLNGLDVVLSATDVPFHFSIAAREVDHDVKLIEDVSSALPDNAKS